MSSPNTGPIQPPAARQRNAPGSQPSDGGGMNAGNTIPVPTPVNEFPGLNAVMVFGENMEAVIGLNHQLALGNNHQICINPFGLLAGIPTMPIPAVLTGALGGMGGNIQLTFGANAQVTVGQAFEINLGQDKISIDAGYKDHLVTVGLCGVLAAAAILYAIGYGLKNAQTPPQYLECGLFTITYQAVVDATLLSIMIIENVKKESEDQTVFGLNTAFGVLPNPKPDDTTTTGLGWLAGCGAGAGLLGAIAAPLVLASDDSQVAEQQSAADAPAGGGSGGGADDGDDDHSVVGKYTITGNNVEIISRTPIPPAIPGPNIITLLATGDTPAGTGPGGRVEVRGNASVRITAGPPDPFFPTSASSINGVEIVVGTMQNIVIQRGMAEFGQRIEMSPGIISIDAGIDGVLTLKAGLSSISLDQTGITIKGLPLVQIN